LRSRVSFVRPSGRITRAGRRVSRRRVCGTNSGKSSYLLVRPRHPGRRSAIFFPLSATVDFRHFRRAGVNTDPSTVRCTAARPYEASSGRNALFRRFFDTCTKWPIIASYRPKIHNARDGKIDNSFSSRRRKVTCRRRATGPFQSPFSVVHGRTRIRRETSATSQQRSFYAYTNWT